uniref:Putative secreted protein n=1 Tax=Anopheles marajoara TaxID=58244 RepID=A0A2M4C7X3_9DIPT
MVLPHSCSTGLGCCSFTCAHLTHWCISCSRFCCPPAAAATVTVTVAPYSVWARSSINKRATHIIPLALPCCLRPSSSSFDAPRYLKINPSITAERYHHHYRDHRQSTGAK